MGVALIVLKDLSPRVTIFQFVSTCSHNFYYYIFSLFNPIKFYNSFLVVIFSLYIIQYVHLCDYSNVIIQIKRKKWKDSERGREREGERRKYSSISEKIERKSESERERKKKG